MEYTTTCIIVLTSLLTALDKSEVIWLGLKSRPRTDPWYVVLRSIIDATALNKGLLRVSVTPTLTWGAHNQAFPNVFGSPRAQVSRSPCLQQFFHTNASDLGNPMLLGRTWCTIRFHFISHLLQVKHEWSHWTKQRLSHDERKRSTKTNKSSR